MREETIGKRYFPGALCAAAPSFGSVGARAGGDSWFFVTADYAFGTAMDAHARRYIGAVGDQR